jgi:hypothetical protein
MQSVRIRIASLIVALGLLALAISPSLAGTINLTPVGSATNSVDSVSLASLISNDDSIVVGDKIFSGFSYSRINDMPEAADVRVLGFRDPVGNWGISLHGAFVDQPGGSASDALVRFMVEIDAANARLGWRINDAHLFMGGVGLGDESFLSVDESFLENDQIMNVFATTLGPGSSQQLSDWVDFPEIVTKLTVTKDIYAQAANDGSIPARTTVIDQSFSQILIPEPSSVALLSVAVAMIGWVGCSNRRRK